MYEFAETAYAKINLALHVRRLRDDGYHELETIFAFIEDGDRLTAKPDGKISLDVDGPFGASLTKGDDNLVLKAAHLLKSHYGIADGAKIGLDKRLPLASGIGGGSADAAAVARLLNRLWRLDASGSELAALLAPLGADIPACVHSETAFGRGTGTELDMLPDNGLAGTPILLANPLRSVSTAAVFRAWSGIDSGALPEGPVADVMHDARNDLEPLALSLCPEIADVLAALRTAEPMLARMSGSGATCFALFASTEERDAASRDIAKACPEWWTMSSLMR